MNEQRRFHLHDGYRKQETSYVLYWMQQAQRVHYNHALNEAIKIANRFDLPLVVFFGLTDQYPEANERHFTFMLEGLQFVKKLLEKLGITYVLRLESPEKEILKLLNDAQALIMDYGYLSHQRSWRRFVYEAVKSSYSHVYLEQIDTDLIVPVKVASDKAEYGAYTLRPKLKKLYQSFRDFHVLVTIKHPVLMDLHSDDDLEDINQLLNKLDIDRSISRSPIYKGGYLEASRLLGLFIREKADAYHDSNDPSKDLTSKLSMYLHFGQISSLEILDHMFLAMEHHGIEGSSFDAFIEQLLVRRELAFNYVTYHDGYDQFDTMTEPWAYQTMKAHEKDERAYLYHKEQIEHSKTHDPYFNAAMSEMRLTGYMHNYMRMYWAKKIIEWTPSFKVAYETIKSLNNAYFIDGRDPNSYAGIAWCFGKHDRPWSEREVFGKLRYMNDKGLERKFDIEAYVQRIQEITNKINGS